MDFVSEVSIAPRSSLSGELVLLISIRFLRRGDTQPSAARVTSTRTRQSTADWTFGSNGVR